MSIVILSVHEVHDRRHCTHIQPSQPSVAQTSHQVAQQCYREEDEVYLPRARRKDVSVGLRSEDIHTGDDEQCGPVIHCKRDNDLLIKALTHQLKSEEGEYGTVFAL